MEFPAKEIAGVVGEITSAPTPELQKAAINKYFASNAALCHPFFSVTGGTLSRESILGIYQWSRVLCSEIKVHVGGVAYDIEEGIIIVDLVQYNQFRMFPFKPYPRRFVCRFTLNKEGGKHYIAKEEDFFHPDHPAALVLPPFEPVVRYMRSAGTVAINVLAKIAQVFGVWRAPAGIEPPNIEKSKENRKRARRDGQEDGQHNSEESSIKRGKKDADNDNKGHGGGEISESRNVTKKRNRMKNRGASGVYENDNARNQAAGGHVKEEN